MQDTISRLIVSPDIMSSIQATVQQTPEGLETGVTLFGVRGDPGFTALAAVGPGPRAIHTPGFHQPDAHYLNDEFQKLRRTWPNLEWIGSLHMHPYGMPYLSGHDRLTVDRLFDDPSLCLTEFVAGIMQRRCGRLAIYPYVITDSDRSPWLMPVEIISVNSDVWKTAEQMAKEPRQVINAFSDTKTVRPGFWRRLMDIGLRCAWLMRRILARNSDSARKEHTYEQQL